MSRWWPAVVALVALAALAVTAVLLPPPPETVVQQRPGASEPVAAATRACGWLGGENGVQATVRAGSLPAERLPAEVAGRVEGAGSAVVTVLGGAADDDAALLGALDTRGDTLAADVDSAEPVGVATEATRSMAPGLLAEAEVRADDEGELWGLATQPCAVPATSAWFVGASGQVGSRPRLVLVNPTDVAAVATVRVWNEAGPVDAPGAEDLGVPARGQRQLALDALAPGSARLAAQVSVSAGRINAAVQVREIDGLDAAGLSWLPATTAPARETVVSGLPGVGRRTLYVAAPGDVEAVVSLRLLGPNGEFAAVGRDVITVAAGTVQAVDVTEALGGAAAGIALRSDVPVTATVRADRTGSGDRLTDFAYAPGGRPLTGATATWATTAPGVRTRLVLSAPDAAASVGLSWRSAAGDVMGQDTLDIAAGATVSPTVRPPAGADGMLVVDPGRARVFATRISEGTTDRGALLDIVALLTPRSSVVVPEVATELSTGLSTGVDGGSG